MPTGNGQEKRKGKIRYAVVGLGYIAQMAVLPAFAHARKNSELAAIVSGDPVKLKQLSKKYRADPWSYDQYDECLRSGIDAVYIALPNSMHRDYAVRAAEAGVHILCEKPLAVTELECNDIIEAAQKNDVRLMTAYRLHFDEPNLRAISFVTSGKIGEPRLFTSSFSRMVKKGNIRLKEDLGGGTLYDLGVYCVNAARYLFRSEPIEVSAFSTIGQKEKFEEVDEMTAAILRFSKGRLATFISSFGGGATDWFEIVGTKGTLRIDNVFDYALPREWRLTKDEKTRTRKFGPSDQFAPELLYFSDCILTGKEPVPSGKEGLADVRVIQALYESAETGKPVSLDTEHVDSRPGISMKIKRPKVRKPRLVHADEASD